MVVDFRTAVSVFRDKDAISIHDEKHSIDEDSWITIGLDMTTKMLVVVHTFVATDKDSYDIKVISARKATKQETTIYKRG